MPNGPIAILGAGLSGLSTAYHLEQRGIQYNLFEREGEVGGLCRTKKINGWRFDYSGHLLHFRNSYVQGLVKKLLSANLVRHRRNSSVYSFARLSPYPFQINLSGLPSHILNECLWGFINRPGQRVKSNKLSFLSWIENTFGPGISRHFMVPYNKKFWRYDLDDLTHEWVSRYIPIPTLNDIIEGAIGNNSKNIGYNSYFWYTRRGGIGELALSFSQKVNNLHLRYQAIKIDLKKRKVYFANNKNFKYSRLVSSLPLVEILKISRGVPNQILAAANKLRWISVFNLNLVLEKNIICDKHWVYFPEKKYVFYRLGFPDNYSNYLTRAKASSLSAEVSYLPGRNLDQDKLSKQIIDDLILAKIILKKDRILLKDTNKIQYGYIIYDRDYANAIRKILGFLKDKGIYCVGRYGKWSYASMEDAILDGKLLAEKISHA